MKAVQSVGVFPVGTSIRGSVPLQLPCARLRLPGSSLTGLGTRLPLGRDALGSARASPCLTRLLPTGVTSRA